MCDLGTDEVRQYSITAGLLEPLTPAAVAMPPGSGPRHMCWHPSLPMAYVVRPSRPPLLRALSVGLSLL